MCTFLDFTLVIPDDISLKRLVNGGNAGEDCQYETKTLRKPRSKPQVFDVFCLVSTDLYA